MKQSKEELEVRMNALKSQYEGRLLRQDRELRELRDSQTHADSRDESQDQSAVKVHAGCTFCETTDLCFSHSLSPLCNIPNLFLCLGW